MSTEILIETISDNTARSEFTESYWNRVGRRTPAWWIVSVTFHALVIALAALVSFEIALPQQDEEAIIVTEYSNQPKLGEHPAYNVPSLQSIYDGTQDFRWTEEVVPKYDNIVESRKMEYIAPPSIDPNTEACINEIAGQQGLSGGATAFGLNDVPNGPYEDVIGSGCGGTGSGDGFGGGCGPGHGTDLRGPHANRYPTRCECREYIFKRGGTPATIAAAEAALRWLANHQEADGHWDSVKFGASQKSDTAVSGLALLALMSAGHSEKVGLYKDNVKRAVAWLESKQQASGMIFDPTDAGAHRGIGYPAAIATLAMAEAAGMGNIPATRAAAQHAVDYCIEAQKFGRDSERLGWRYAPGQPGDTSVTGWFVIALKSAKVSGLHVDPLAFEGALNFLKSVENKEAGEYSEVIRYGYQPGDDHSASPHRLTAIGLLIRVFLGATPEDVKPSVESFVSKGGVPEWGANGESVDMYYWYYGTLATFQSGGDVWKSWNKAMRNTLTENQCKFGDDMGSWPIVGAYASEWGRVGQTAFGALNLEVYCRYPRYSCIRY